MKWRNTIPEPEDLEEFFENLRKAFQMAATTVLYDLNVFRGVPEESLTKLANRFDVISRPLIRAPLVSDDLSRSPVAVEDRLKDPIRSSGRGLGRNGDELHPF